MLITKGLNKETATSLQYLIITLIPLINYIVGVWLGSGGLYISLIMILILSLYKLTKKESLIVSPSWLVYFVLLVMYGALSENSDINTFQKIIYIFLPAFVAISKIDMRKFLRFSTYSSLIILSVFPSLIRDLSNNGIRQVSINGVSYAVLPILVAGLFHFTFFGKERTDYIIRICYFIDIVLGFILLIYANRGVVLSLVIAIFASLIFNQKKNKTIKRKVILGVLFIIAIVFVLNFQSILVFLHDTLSKAGIEVAFINKLTLLNQRNDISNGRSGIGDYVLSHVGESFVWGHGLSTIYINSGGSIVYPHNMLLQLLYDGGLLLSVPIFVLLVSMLFYLFKGKDNNIRILILFYSVVCIPKLMLSSNIWLNPAFWLFVFAMFNHSGVFTSSSNSSST